MTPHAVTEETPAVSEKPQFLPTDKNYRLTGEMPAVTEEAPAASTETEEEKDTADTGEASAASASDTAAASEAATSADEGRVEPRRKTAATSESRWAKISRENRELREKLARAEGLADGRTPRETQQTSQAATTDRAKPSAKPKIDDLDPKTNQPKFKTYAEYEEAKDTWNRQEAIREFQETSQKTARETQQAQIKQTIAQEWGKRCQAAEKETPDFREVALNPDLPIKEGSVVDVFILDSPVGAKVLYHLGQNPDLLDSINQMNPIGQARELTKLEIKFSGTASADTAKPSSSAKPVTQAARPPHQVSGTGTVAKDSIEQAVDDGDVESYMKAQNAKELARLKRK